MRNIRRIALGTLLLLAGGCTTVHITAGGAIPPTVAREIAPGAAKTFVIERLGPPDIVRFVPGGTEFVYAYGEEEGSNVQLSFAQASVEYDAVRTRLDRLFVRFDGAGVVREVGVTKSP